MNTNISAVMSKNDIPQQTFIPKAAAVTAKAEPRRQSFLKRLASPPSTSWRNDKPLRRNSAAKVIVLDDECNKPSPTPSISSRFQSLMSSVSRRKARPAAPPPPAAAAAQPCQTKEKIVFDIPSRRLDLSAKKHASTSDSKPYAHDTGSAACLNARRASNNRLPLESRRLSDMPTKKRNSFSCRPSLYPRFLLGRSRPVSHFTGLADIAARSDDKEDCRVMSRPVSGSSTSMCINTGSSLVATSWDEEEEDDDESCAATSSCCSSASINTSSQIAEDTDQARQSQQQSSDKISQLRRSIGFYPSSRRDNSSEELTGALSSNMTFPPQPSMSSDLAPKRPPTRARTVFTVAKLDLLQHKKEMKAVAVWRNTVSQLQQQGSVKEDKPRTPTPKDAAICKFIMNELYTTELSYLGLLTLIQTRYMQPMVAAARTTHPLIKSSDIPILFRHLPEMIALSQKMVDFLEPYTTHFWHDCQPVHIGQMFQDLEQGLVVFVKYAVHYASNSKVIRRACNNVLFLKIEQESLARNRMGIADYFIAPFQRAPRYCLLIKDLIRHSDARYHNLDLILKMLTGLTMAMDNAQKNSR